MLVATELNVGDMAQDATSEGLAVILLKRDWNRNGKLLSGPDANSDPWWLPFGTTSLALWLMLFPFRFVIWFKRRKFVLLLDIGELQAVGGWDFEGCADGDIELCWVTVYGIKLWIDSEDLNDSLRNCFTWLFCFCTTWYRVGLASFVRTCGWSKLWISGKISSKNQPEESAVEHRLRYFAEELLILCLASFAPELFSLLLSFQLTATIVHAEVVASTACAKWVSKFWTSVCECGKKLIRS